MQLIPVASSRIQALGYDEDTFVCYVQFHPRHPDAPAPVYAYANVSPEMFHDFQTAPSIGVFFAEHLRGNPDHPYRRVREPLPQSTAPHPAAEESFTTFENAIETAVALARRAASFEITTPDAYRQAGEELMRLAAERKRRIDYFRPMKEAAFAAHRAICARENEALAPLRAAEAALQAGLVDYRRAEERTRRQRQLLLDAENHRAAQQESDRQSAQLAALQEPDHSAGDSTDLASDLAARFDSASQWKSHADLAGAALAPTSYPHPVVAQTDVPDIDGLSFARDWTFRVEDETKVPLSHEWYSLDLKKIRAFVKRMKQHAVIPGVRVYPVERSRKRAA
jgi:hypothetical protein